MACYIVSYNLIKERNYEKLYDALKSYRTWAKITESTWAIVTNKTATEVRDHLSKFIDEDDRLFVVKSGVASAWRNVRCRNEWLKKHL